MSQHSHVKRKEDNAYVVEIMIMGNVERGLNPNVVICEGHTMQRLLTVKPKNKLQKE